MNSILGTEEKSRRTDSESPFRQHDPNPDRIPRTDTNPAPNSVPVQPSHPKPLPTTNPPGY